MKLLKFYTNTCCQCKMLTKALENFTLVPIEHIDCENDPEGLAVKFQVRGLPTLVLVDDEGEFLRKFTGYITRENLEEVLNKEFSK